MSEPTNNDNKIVENSDANLEPQDSSVKDDSIIDIDSDENLEFIEGSEDPGFIKDTGEGTGFVADWDAIEKNYQEANFGHHHHHSHSSSRHRSSSSHHSSSGKHHHSSHSSSKSTKHHNSKKKDSKTAKARQIAIYAIRECTELTQQEISEYFGGRDRTAIHYAIEKTAPMIERDPNLRRTVENIIKNAKEQ